MGLKPSFTIYMFDVLHIYGVETKEDPDSFEVNHPKFPIQSLLTPSRFNFISLHFLLSLMAVEMFVSAAISTVTEKARDFVLKDFTTSLGLGVEQDRQKLCSLLLTVQSVIADAEERSKTEPSVRGWLHDLMDVVYQTEVVLDELKYHAISKAVETEIRSEKKSTPVPLSLSFSCWVNFLHWPLLKGVLEKMKAVVAQMNEFHLSIRYPK